MPDASMPIWSSFGAMADGGVVVWRCDGVAVWRFDSNILELKFQCGALYACREATSGEQWRATGRATGEPLTRMTGHVENQYSIIQLQIVSGKRYLRPGSGPMEPRRFRWLAT